jgi:hypothetical protein
MGLLLVAATPLLIALTPVVRNVFDMIERYYAARLTEKNRRLHEA